MMPVSEAATSTTHSGAQRARSMSLWLMTTPKQLTTQYTTHPVA